LTRGTGQQVKETVEEKYRQHQRVQPHTLQQPARVYLSRPVKEGPLPAPEQQMLERQPVHEIGSPVWEGQRRRHLIPTSPSSTSIGSPAVGNQRRDYVQRDQIRQGTSHPDDTVQENNDCCKRPEAIGSSSRGSYTEVLRRENGFWEAPEAMRPPPAKLRKAPTRTAAEGEPVGERFPPHIHAKPSYDALEEKVKKAAGSISLTIFTQRSSVCQC